jgi:hypothetical protein
MISHEPTAVGCIHSRAITPLTVKGGQGEHHIEGGREHVNTPRLMLPPNNSVVVSLDLVLHHHVVRHGREDAVLQHPDVWELCLPSDCQLVLQGKFLRVSCGCIAWHPLRLRRVVCGVSGRRIVQKEGAALNLCVSGDLWDTLTHLNHMRKDLSKLSENDNKTNTSPLDSPWWVQ